MSKNFVFFSLLVVAAIGPGCKSRTAGGSAVLTLTDQGFAYQSIKVKVTSADNQPVQGVGVSYVFAGKKFYWSNPNVITPGISPGVYATVEKSGEMGTTGQDGVFAGENVKIELDEGSDKKPAELQVYIQNGGGKSDLCANGNVRPYVAWGSVYLLPRANDANGGPVYCQRVVTSRNVNDPASFEMKCILDRSLADFTEVKTKAFNRDCQ